MSTTIMGNTNYDRLTHMSVDELVEWLFTANTCVPCVHHNTICHSSKVNKSCHDGIREWLLQSPDNVYKN